MEELRLDIGSSDIHNSAVTIKPCASYSPYFGFIMINIKIISQSL